MIHSRVVPKGYEYYIDSFNYYHFHAIMPLSSYNYRVEVLFPVYDVVEQEIEPPAVDINDIGDWLLSIKDYILDENHILYNIATMLIDIAKSVIDYSFCGNDLIYKRTIALYVGHHLEFHFQELKDQEYKMSLQPEIDLSRDTKDKELTISYDAFMGEYKKTIYGRQFWTIYGQHAKFLLGYRPY